MRIRTFSNKLRGESTRIISSKRISSGCQRYLNSSSAFKQKTPQNPMISSLSQSLAREKIGPESLKITIQRAKIYSRTSKNFLKKKSLFRKPKINSIFRTIHLTRVVFFRTWKTTHTTKTYFPRTIF